MPVRRPPRVFLMQTGATAFTQGVMWTVLTIYYVRVVHMNPLELILAGTVMEIAVFLVQVPSGAAADAYGRRRSVAFGTVVAGAGVLLMVAVPAFWCAALGLSVWGVGVTFVDGAREAWIAGEVGEAAVGALFLRATRLEQLAGVAGTAVSAVLASISLRLPFVAGGAATVGLGAFLGWAMTETAAVRGGPHPTPVPSVDAEAEGPLAEFARLRRVAGEGLRSVRASPVLLWLLGAAAVAGAGGEGWDRLWEAHLLIDFRFPAWAHLQPVVWFAVIGVAARIADAGLLRALDGRLRTLMRGPGATAGALAAMGALAVAAVAVFGLVAAFPVAVAAVLVRSAARALSAPLFQTWLVQSTDARVRATALSVWGQADALGQFTGGPAIGAVGTLFGLRAAMLAVGGTMLPALPMYAAAARHRPPAQAAAPEGAAAP